MPKAAAKSANPLDARREAQTVIASIDLERAKTVKAIFERPEIIKAREELEAILDTSPGAERVGAATNVNALVRSGVIALGSMVEHANGHIATLEAVVNPPEDPAQTAAAMALTLPET